MSSHFSANQYESAFTSKSLGNWEVPATYKSRPVTLKGTTKVIADDAGHLRENVPRSPANPWGNFIGTWEMPKKIAGNQARVPTGRTGYAQQKLGEEAKAAESVLTGAAKNINRTERLNRAPPKPMTPVAPVQMQATEAPKPPIEVMCDVIAMGRSPTPPERSPLPPNPALIDSNPKPLFRSADL